MQGPTLSIALACRHRRLLPYLLILLVLAGGSTWLPAQTPPLAASRDDVFIVRLRHPSVVEHLVAGAPKGSNLSLLARSRPAENYSAQLRAEHQDFVDRISVNPGLSMVGECTYLINVVFIRGSSSAAGVLESDPEVSGVYPSHLRYPVLDSSIGMIQAPKLWDQLGGLSEAGRGIKIAIIDSGIYQDHVMFRDDGLTPPAGFPKVDGPAYLEFTTNKVIVARSFWRLFPDPTRTIDHDPIDQQGHGSRVAAIAAGRVTDAPLATIEGVAPMAFLGNYKIFGSGRNSSTTSAAVAAAIDQAARDGMDVINLSIGGSALEPGTEPEQEAIANAVKLGIVVVAAAGNLGPDAETVTFPGSSPDVITVGAISNAHVFAPDVEVDAQGNVPPDLRSIPYVPGQGVSLMNALGPTRVVSVTDWDPSGEACSPLPIPDGTLSGEAVLVKRGTCTFREKSENVFAAGAGAMLVFNNVRGRAIQMGNVLTTSPSVMIERTSGEALQALIRDHPSSGVTVLLQPSVRELELPAARDEVASFSGRGPNLDGTLKPDLVAIGTDVYTASNSADLFSGHSNGTSFSTPMVSGAAALLRQLHRDWPVEAIKSALLLTAVKTPYIGNQPAHLDQMGGGRLDLSRVADVDSTVDPASISFGFVDQADQIESRTLTITNHRASTQQYSLHFEPWLGTSDGAVAFSPDVLSLASGESAEIEVTLDIAKPPEAGAVEGFMVISRDREELELTVPVWGVLVAEDPETTLTVSQEDPAAFHTLAEALQVAGPGNLIEITDSGTYHYQGTVSTSAHGVPLNGLRIRSRPGEHPTIDATGFSEELPVLSISGVQRVTLEGLRFRGSRYGIAFNGWGSTGVIRDCAIDVDAGTMTGFGISLNGSRVHLYGNRITGTGDTVIRVVAGDALLQGNRITTSDSLGRTAVSIMNSGASALFDNSLEGGPLAGIGIDANVSSLLVKGNRILGFGRSTSAGIRVMSNQSVLDAVDNLISDNGQAGIFLLGGAEANLRRNRLLDNASAGIRVESDALLNAHGETISGNGRGISVDGAAVNLSDSVVAFSDHQGIDSADSSLQLINDTIFGNGGAGVSSSSSILALVANSISCGNNPGPDLVGIDTPASFRNLTGVQVSGGGGTSCGSDLLKDPQNGDFSPAHGSLAIDRGSNDYSVAFETDLAGHRRIVDGNGDGISQVDIGALEYASPSSPPLILPLTNPRPDEFIGLALTNAQSRSSWTTTESTEVNLTAHDDDGSLHSNPPVQLSPMSQSSRLLSQLLEGAETGWLELLPNRPNVVGFTLVGDYARNRLDGIALGDPPAPVQILPEVRTTAGSSTRVFIVNPTSQPAQVLLQWIAGGEQPISAHVKEIAPEGRLEISLAELFGERDRGYVRIESQSGTPLSSMELFGNDSAIAALSGISPERGASRLYGAQLAMTPTVESQVSLVNLGQGATVTLEAIAESGQPVASRTLSLGGGECWRGQAAQLFGVDELVGWLRVSSDRGSLVGSVTFSDPSGRWMASLPLEDAGARESMFSHVAQTPEIYTGLTLLNPDSAPALVSIEVFDADGTPTGTALTELDPGEKRARLLPEWIPSLAYQVEGFVRVRSNRPVIGFELFGSTANLAAVPQQVVVR